MTLLRPDSEALTLRTRPLVSTETRVDRRDDSTATFHGHAALFNVRTWIGPKRFGFHEEVAPGAFTKSIGESDVRFLKNHNPDMIIARTTAGDLQLAEDKVGLLVDSEFDTRKSYSSDFALDLELKHITQMSFAFEIVREEWSLINEDEDLRTITEAKLWDVSGVTYPAYEETDAGLRADSLEWLNARMGLTTTKRSRLVAGFVHGNRDDAETIAILRDARTQLDHLLDGTAPAPATPPVGTNGDPAPAIATRGPSLALMERRHRLLASRHGL